VTRAFTGRHARGIRNRLARDLEAHAERLAPFPYQAVLAADVREEATRRGEHELMTLLCGQGLRLARALPAAELVETLVRESEAILARLSA
jgi:nitronate monooxygenase